MEHLTDRPPYRVEADGTSSTRFNDDRMPAIRGDSVLTYCRSPKWGRPTPREGPSTKLGRSQTAARRGRRKPPSREADAGSSFLGNRRLAREDLALEEASGGFPVASCRRSSGGLQHATHRLRVAQARDMRSGQRHTATRHTIEHARLVVSGDSP